MRNKKEKKSLMSENMKVSVISAVVGAVITGAVSLLIFFLGNFSTQATFEKKTVETLSQYFESVDENMSYKQALQTISEESDKLNDDTFNKIIKIAQSYGNSNDYAKALEVLMAVDNKSVEIHTLIDEYSKKYEGDIVEQANVLRAEEKFEEANVLIKDALKVIPDSQILKEKQKEIEKAYPKNMLDIVPAYQCGGNSYKEYISSKNGATEAFYMGGVKYTNGMTFNADINIFNDVSWAAYNLNGEYNSLQFTVCHVDGTDNGNKTVLQVFYDGELKEEISLAPDMAPRFVSLDISEVEQLKLQVPSSGSDNPIYGLGNPTLK